MFLGEIKYSKYSWRGIIKPENIDVAIDGDVHGPCISADQISQFVEELPRKIEEAKYRSLDSVYRDDVIENNGITPSFVLISADETYLIWFKLGSTNRYLGVRFNKGEEVSFYCDPPDYEC